jgi:hypothetical protein
MQPPKHKALPCARILSSVDAVLEVPQEGFTKDTISSQFPGGVTKFHPGAVGVTHLDQYLQHFSVGGACSGGGGGLLGCRIDGPAARLLR